MSAVMDARFVMARKPHRCEGCSRMVPKGERYHRAKSIDDYGWRTYRECEQCYLAAGDLWEADYRDEDDNGRDCYAYLPDVDWHDVALWSPLWALRAERYRAQWAGQPYPADEVTA